MAASVGWAPVAAVGWEPVAAVGWALPVVGSTAIGAGLFAAVAAVAGSGSIDADLVAAVDGGNGSGDFGGSLIGRGGSCFSRWLSAGGGGSRIFGLAANSLAMFLFAGLAGGAILVPIGRSGSCLETVAGTAGS